MCPILFKFGFIQIYSYGLLVALAFLASGYLFSKRVHLLGLSEDFAWNFCALSLFGGIIGGRLLFVLLNFGLYRDNPAEIFMLWHGGLIWYGGFIGGFLSAIGYLLIKKVSVIKVFDLIAPYLALAQAIGRIGCILNGCCYGVPAAWGFYFPASGGPLIPTQVFSSLGLVAIFCVLRFMQDRPHRAGMIFIAYLLFYSTKRFFIEFLRDDSARAYLGLTIFQIISLSIFTAAFALWIITILSQKRKKAGG